MKTIDDQIVDALAEATEGKIGTSRFESLLHPTKDRSLADRSIACHALAKDLGSSPADIASDLAEILQNGMLSPDDVENVSHEKGFLNFTYNTSKLAEETITQIVEKGPEYGSSSEGEGKSVVVDYSAPNIGKPMHVGHIRSTILGDSMIRLFEFTGHSTHGINYLGDSGLHLGKLITAYELWGSREEMEHDPEKAMLGLYVRFGKESEKSDSLKQELSRRAQEVVRELDRGHSEHDAFLNEIERWSLEIFDRAYDLLDISFDETTGQSHFSSRGKEIVGAACEKGLAQRIEDEGSQGIEVDLEEYGLPSKMVLKSDGTAIYSTQDIGAAVSRWEDHHFDKMVYVVATEQDLYFQQLFSILDSFGYEWSDRCHHLGFGLINLEEGRMSTREGQVVFLEDVLEKAVTMAQTEMEERGLASDRKTAEQIGVGAIKYMVLSIDPVKNITFSWDRALDFNGDSGPYLQYAHARATRLLEKGDYKGPSTVEVTTPYERAVVKRLSEFPSVVAQATEAFKPNLVAQYAFNLASEFNEFYTNVHILGEPEQDSRLTLTDTARTTLRNAAGLLGMHLPERM